MRTLNPVQVWATNEDAPPAIAPALLKNTLGPIFSTEQNARDFIERHGDPERTYHLVPFHPH